MASIDLGKIKITWKSVLTMPRLLMWCYDAVYYSTELQSWIFNKHHRTGNLPTNGSAYWDKMSARIRFSFYIRNGSR